MTTQFFIEAGKDETLRHLVDGKAAVVEVEIDTDGNAIVCGPEAFKNQWSIILKDSLRRTWFACEGPARMLEDKEYIEIIWNLFVAQAFAVAGLPEVQESDLEPGMHTNAQIAALMMKAPGKLLVLLLALQQIGNEAEKRSIVSRAVDIINKKN